MGVSLTDLMMAALDSYMAQRRESEDFKAKAQQALEEAEAQMAQDQGHAARHVARGSAYGVSPAGLRRSPQAGVDARRSLPAEVGS